MNRLHNMVCAVCGKTIVRPTGLDWTSSVQAECIHERDKVMIRWTRVSGGGDAVIAFYIKGSATIIWNYHEQKTIIQVDGNGSHQDERYDYTFLKTPDEAIKQVKRILMGFMQ